MHARPLSRALAHLRSRLRDDAGFTLPEVIVSFVIFAVVTTAATYGVLSSLSASHKSQQHVDAGNVAQRYIADQQLNAQSARNGTATYPASVQGESFMVKRTVSFFNGSTACNPGGSYTVDVEVYQTQKDGTDRFMARSDTVITC